ncbi:probable Hgl1p, required for dimorphism and teliospore formation [Sporisorium reilianum f. sp. reilianum]|uniref:Probable Hgl1p, required for dimorphism and teliospore formation n=1 Tax=Sporisorium reilianum f. sp. reilianum TaxID=72559 RepID=A0A2N8U8R6_9BASI|nr:probable Hgl1p, required for dimorphism and teliospore formation [Sporisorium reilianum f. sp. reilianum]
MSVATRRASLTPSSPAVSRRGSWVDLPAPSALSSRRGSRADLSASSASGSTADSCASGSHHTKLSINQLLSNFSHVSESQSRMSSPKGSRSPALSEAHGAKRKHEPDTDSPASPSTTAFRISSASEIHLPSDPVRRASIINLATAAAAAVLQSQAGQRRMSVHPEQEQKRQRVEHLGMLIEQARKASVTSMSHDMSRHVETASQNVAIATVLANHLGLTPQSSAASTPSAGTPAPSSPTKPHASTLAVPQTPTTPKSPLSAAPLTAAHVSDDRASLAQDATAASLRAVKGQEKASQQMPAPPSPTSMPAITLTNSTDSAAPGAAGTVLAEPLRDSPSPPASSQAIFDRAKEAAHTYSRFYRFEKEWAHKALELERRRSSIRIDPLFNPNPTLSPLAGDAHEDKPRAPGPTSPQQHSAPESRIVSRGTSPFGEVLGVPAAKASHSVSSGSFSSSHRGSSSSLANVLSNFAELIEHRQRSCSGLEALAKQAKELPVKRLSQPNPQFRTTFGDFSWAKVPRSATDPAAASAPAPVAAPVAAAAASAAPWRTSPSCARTQPLAATAAAAEADVDADSKASLTMDRDGGLSHSSDVKPTSRPAHLQIKSIKEETADWETDAPATPRSSMSIASML